MRGKRDAVLRQLRRRFGDDLPQSVMERVEATATGDELDLLLDQAVTAPTLAATGLLNGDAAGNAPL